MDGPFLWFLNRGTGFVLLALLTLTVVAGILATRGRAGGLVPRFLTQTVHRDLGLVTVAALTVHVVSAVLDGYVDIRWWHAFIPAGATYEPVWLGLGTLALDLVAVVVLSSLLRRRMPHRAWWVLHLSTYAAWGVSVVHGLGIGTDTGTGIATATYVACAAVVGLAVGIRLTGLALDRLRLRFHTKARGARIVAGASR
jgi:sulfoxide reductase heme-binding subunit YedZ